MANTTNYNWETPDDTDLVKDGAAAIRTLGSSIDTTTKNLNPQTTTGALAYRSATANVNTALPIGTAGQILSVSGGVPAWINNDQGDITEVAAGTGISVASGTGPVPTVSINTAVTADLTTAQTLTNKTLTSPVLTTPTISTIDAKGDLLVGTADNTIGRLAVGTNDYVLTAASGETTGLKWAAPSASSGPAFRAFRNTSVQNVSGSTWTKVELNGETFDTDSCFDSTTNFRFTPNKAGYYKFTGSVDGEAQVSTSVFGRAAIYKNGSVAAQGVRAPAFGDEFASQVSDLIYLNGTTDYVELYGFIAAGSVNENFINGTSVTYFQGVWIRS